jgi:hypothetical protein
MPIEVMFLPDDNNLYDITEILGPNEGVILDDFSTLERQVISITCDEDDTYGEVKVMKSEGTLESPLKYGDYIREFPEPILAVKLDETTPPYEQRYINDDGIQTTLKVKYVAAKITSSGIIPKALMNPN